MAGFLDRIAKAARAVKARLVESRILDRGTGAAEGRASAAAGAAELHLDPPPDLRVAAAVGRGAADPKALLTAADIEAVTGFAVLRGDHFDEEWFGVVFTPSVPGEHFLFELRVCHGHIDAGRYDPEGCWRYLRDEVTPQIDVAGIGDDAFRSSDSTIFVRSGGQIFHTVMTAPSGYPVGEKCEELATLVASRL